MFRRILSNGGVVVLAAAVLAWNGSLASAQHHGGGGHGGGGYHGGGGHPGGGGYHGGGAYHGGYGGYHGGYTYHGGYGYAHYGYYPWYGGGINLGFGYWPGYYGAYYGGYYAPYYGSIPSYSVYPPVYYSSPPAYAGIPEVSPAYGPALVTVPPTAGTVTAQVRVHVPADAQVWIEGTLTSSTGSDRLFESPPLAVGPRYRYEIRAAWMQEGRQVSQTRTVEVQAGTVVSVDFTQPAPGQ